MKPRKDGTYTMLVRFTRNYSDDAGVVGSPVTKHKLVQQLRKELQMAYDDNNVAMAGSFDILKVES
jgi:hypothetical protein